jgi:hypothetical protein
MKKNLENLERKVREKMGRIMCLIIHGLCVIFNALERSVETSEVLLAFNGNSNPLSVN